MSFKRWLQTARDAIKFKAGAWAGGSGFMATGIGFILNDYTALGSLFIGLGMAMFAWGTTFWGRNFWEPWWLGPLKPDVDAYFLDFPYGQGANVNGITWDQDFSHVNIRIANRSGETITDINLVIYLDLPIIKSVSVSPMADCTIGPAISGVPQLTWIATDKSGKKVALTEGESIVVAKIRPSDRFLCAKLPQGVEAQLHLATVIPLDPPWKGKMWTKGEPTWLRLRGTYVVRGIEQHVLWHFPFEKAAHDVTKAR